MGIDIKVTCKCIECDKKIESDELSYTCEDCIESNEQSRINRAFHSALENQPWNECVYDDPKSKETEIFRRGVRYGVYCALFSIGNFYGDISIIEKLEHLLFEKKKKI